MGPQPLSKVNPKARPAFTRRGLPISPHSDLNEMVLTVISTASGGEQSWGLIFVSLLHANPVPSYAMYSGLDSASARKAILMAAAEAVLSAEDFMWLRALQKAVGPAFSVRHKFAHQIWSHSPDVPDALLLIDPGMMLEDITWSLEGFHQKARGEPTSPKQMIDPTRIMVWSRKALEGAVEDITLTCNAISSMRQMLVGRQTPPSLTDQGRSTLLKWPRFAQALRHIQSKTPR